MSFFSRSLHDDSCRRLNLLERVLGLFVVFIGSWLVVPGQAQAQEPTGLSDETPTKIAEKVAEDGVYISANRSDVERGPLVQVVGDASDDGVKLVVVVPDFAEPDAVSFARRMQEQAEADAVMIIPSGDETIATYASEEFESSRVRAGRRAQKVSDPVEATEVFVEELQSESKGRVPIIVLLMVAGALVLLYVAYSSSALELKERAKKKVALDSSQEE